MAEEHDAEPGDLELDRRRPPRDAVEAVGAEPRRAPAAAVAGSLVVGRATPRGRRCPSGSGRAPDRLEPVEALGGSGPQTRSPPETITSASAQPRIGEHGLERRQVAVHVVERRDPHARHATGRVSSGARSHGAPSPGPAQTRSSAGQPEHANALGVGRKSPSRMRAIAAPSSRSSASTSPRENARETTSSGASRNW